MEAYQLDTKLSFVNNSIFCHCVYMCMYRSLSLSLFVYLSLYMGVYVLPLHIDSFNGAITVRMHVLAPRMTRERSHVFFLYFFNSIFSVSFSLFARSLSLLHILSNIHSTYSLQNINYFPLFTDG